jgi:hypothetical protein
MCKHSAILASITIVCAAACSSNAAPPARRVLPYYVPAYLGYGYHPVGGYAAGVADIVAAQGQFILDAEQSRLLLQQRKQARSDTRRNRFDEWQYERAHTPTLEDERERSRLEELRRSRNDPPKTEIWSAKALNDLLYPISKANPGEESTAPYVPLDANVVRHINLSSGATMGSLGVLKDAGKLRWPAPLQGDQYKKNRQGLDEFGPRAFKEAQEGAVQAQTIRELTDSVDAMTEQLKRNVGKIPSNDYIPARRYLRELESAIRTLQDPNVANYANGKWAAKGDTVHALVANMNRQGLKFAPAVEGDESAYIALHRALVAYECGLSRIAGR